MASKYVIMVEAQLNQAQLQSQLNTMTTTKPVNIRAQVQLDQGSIDNQIQLWQNKLEKLQILNPNAFNTQEIKNLSANVDTAISSYTGLRTEAKDVQVAFSNLDVGLAKYNQTQIDVNRNGMNMTDMLTLAAKKVLIWAAATTLIYGSLRQINEGIQYIKDLNVEMTNTQIVTGYTNEQISKLAIQYNSLATELGTTTLEVAKGALEWQRQGKPIEETTELLKASTKMATLGNMDAASSTEKLTATLNGFKLGASDAIGVIDKLINLDNNYATSVEEIITAMQYSSAVAQQAGITFDQLASYITVVSSVTRMSAETVGQSFKTMLTRMDQVKAGASVDEFGDSINNVEKVLNSFDIQLRDTPSHFRPLSDVLSEVAGKWDTMSQAQQNQIATAIAGVRQMPQFLTLMSNWNKVLEAQSLELNSAGLATQRYGIYLNSVQAHANQFTDAMNRVWQTTLDSGAISKLYDVGTGFLNLISDIGGLTPVVEGFAAALLMANTQLIITAVSALPAIIGNFVTFLGLLVSGIPITETLTLAFGTLDAAMLPVTVVLGILIALAYGWITINNDMKSGLEKTSGAWDSMFSNIDNGAGASEKTLNTFKTGIDNVTKSLDSMNGVYKILIDLLGIKSKEIDQGLQSTITKLKSTSSSYSDYINNVKKAANIAGYEIDNQGRLYKAYGNGSKQIKVYASDIKIASNAEFGLSRATSEVMSKLRNINTVEGTLSKTTKTLINNTGDLKDAMNDLQTLVAGQVGSTYRDFVKKQQELAQTSVDLKAKFEELSKQPVTLDQQRQLFDLNNQIQANNQAIEDNATEWHNAIGRIIFDMVMQRIQAEVTSKSITDAQATAAINTLMAWATSYGLIDQATATAMMGVNLALDSYFNNVTGNDIPATNDFKNALDNLVGTYNIYIVTHHIDVFGGPTPDGGQGGRKDLVTAGDISQPTPNIPPGGFYGGGGGKYKTKTKATQQQEDMNALLQMTINLIKQQAEDEKKLLTNKQKELDLTLKKEQAEIKAKQDSLKAELDSYKQIIDSRKSILQSEQQEKSYQQDIADKNKAIAKDEQELAILKLDNSQESKAKQLEIQNDLNNKLADLEKTQSDHSYQMQSDALDKEYIAYETNINGQIDLLTKQSDAFQAQHDTAYQAIQDQIDKIDEYLSKSGLVEADAIKMITDKSSSLYQQLVDWNKIYGTSIKDDVTKAWNEAYAALKKYKDVSDAISGGSSIWSKPVPTGNAGVSITPIASLTQGINSVLANMIGNSNIISESDISSIINGIPNLANMVSNNAGGVGGGGLVIGNLINVEGNVDKNVVQDLNLIVDKVTRNLVDTLAKRGFLRNANVYST